MVTSTLRWIVSSGVRLVYGGRAITVSGEAGVPFSFRPAEYPRLLKGGGRVDVAIRKAWQVLLRPGEVVLDVGANIGFTVHRVFAVLGGDCTVWAFEPIPRNCELLMPNVAALASDRIRVVDCAVASEDGEAVFCDNVKHGALSRLASTMDEGRKDRPLNWKEFQEIKVKTVSLDSFLERHADVEPTFLKIDVEGAGVGVLQGAEALLARYKPLLNCEFHSDGERRGMLRMVEQAGYRGVAFGDAWRCRWCDLESSAANFLHPEDPRVKVLGISS